jgi:hypothetical protein
MRRRLILAAATAALLVLPATGAAHILDHAAPGFQPQNPPPATFLSGGRDAEWELLATIPTGNPHTDLDFFTRNGETYVSAGTLAIGPNSGGQTIVQLTDGGQVTPRVVGTHPSASCLSNPSAATGLQHDVEATPKGDAILNTFNPRAVRRNTQLLIDATDAEGRCHDQGGLGITTPPQGGLEIVDVTRPGAPKEIGLTSHIGEAHTVNIDPKRPHIAYAVTSDAVTVTAGKRENEIETDSDRFDLDGFEVVDLRSCMNFPAGTPIGEKRQRCRPEVYRYRYTSLAMAQGHTNKNTVYGCHELEIYPDDRLTCGSGQALIVLDMRNAFDDRGTPSDFTDDRPRGTPLPCRARPTSNVGPSVPFSTGAIVTDCVDGTGAGTDDLTVAKWLKSGAPRLEGVRHVGTAFHQGRNSTEQSATPAFNSLQDIDFDHEAELTTSRRFLLATDERGGGIAPPGASCPTSPADNPLGNGGVHAYRADRLFKSTPGQPIQAWQSYARKSGGGKAIYRAQIRTQPQGSICTAHVFQQIPGQNRIFMGWYSQGTQVIDFTENPNGTIDFREAGFFIPTNADTWTSAVFKAQRNRDGSFTYWGATGDFNLTGGGRNAIDVYRVTLPPSPTPRGGTGGRGAPPLGPGGGSGGDGAGGGASCDTQAGFSRAEVRRRPRGALKFSFDRTTSAPAKVKVLRVSSGRRVRAHARKVKVFRNRTESFRWRPKRTLKRGFYVVKIKTARPDGGTDVRRFAVKRGAKRFKIRPPFARGDSCGLVGAFRLNRPVFGGVQKRKLKTTFTVNESANVKLTITRRNGDVVRTTQRRPVPAGEKVTVKLRARDARRGHHLVTISAERPGRSATITLAARKL